jgi:predicted Rossmann-fold nucleotide-binding protein
MVNFEALVEEGMISPEDLDIFGYADDADEAWETLLAKGLRVPTELTT